MLTAKRIGTLALIVGVMGLAAACGSSGSSGTSNGGGGSSYSLVEPEARWSRR